MLADRGLIVLDGARVIVPDIDAYVPPPSVRQKSTDRVQRLRAHREGLHHLCLPKHCADAPKSSALEPPDVPARPVQSRPGETSSETRYAPEPVTDWPVVQIPVSEEEPW